MIVSPYQQPFRGLQINRTHPLARKLIGCWPFNDGTGKKTWDYSGNANKGTLEGGATWAPGRRGWAVNCDGVDGRIDCGNGVPLDDLGNGSFWLSFWMKSKDTVPLNHGALFYKWEDGINQIHLSSSGTTNRIRFYFAKTGTVKNILFSVSSAPFDTIGNHIVLVVNRTTEKALFYVNTIKDSVEGNLAGLPADASNSANISWGSRHDGLAYSYEGLLANCLAGKGILSQEQINWLYREPYTMFIPWRRQFVIERKIIRRTSNLYTIVDRTSNLFTKKEGDSNL